MSQGVRQHTAAALPPPPTAQVREAVTLSALLKLGPEVPLADKMERVDAALQELVSALQGLAVGGRVRLPAVGWAPRRLRGRVSARLPACARRATRPRRARAGPLLPRRTWPAASTP